MRHGALVHLARDEAQSGHNSWGDVVLDLSRVVIGGLAALLALAGYAKVRGPGPSAAMLRAAGVPAPLAAARVVAIAELGVVALVLTLPGTIGGATVALAFACLSVGAAVGARRAGDMGCGCFGEEGAPLGP